MRIVKAIDRYLGQMQVERDWTPRTIDSVYRTLVKLADEHPEARLADFDGRAGTDKLRDHIAQHYGRLAAATRATRISYHHTFWAWAEEEGFVDEDPARRIKRPPKRRPDVYRPSAAELELGERACTIGEIGPWALMARRGFRAATVTALRWNDFDLQRGRVRVEVKGGHRDWVPLGGDVARILQHVYRETTPDPDDHVFTVERELWVDQEHRRRTVRDPKTPASTKALWSMVGRVCKRAGIRPLGPHALRHGFATGFLRDSDRDVVSLQRLLGHSRIDTTKGYVNELELEEIEDALQRASDRRSGTASGDATSVAEEDDEEGLDVEAPLDPASGGGGNRTRVRTGPSRKDERQGTRDDDEPPLEPPSRRHDV